MSLLTDILKGIGARGGKQVGKMALGGPLGRAALGGLVGGAYAGFTTDNEGFNNTFEAVARGAFFGATIGAASRLVTPAWTKGAGWSKPWGVNIAKHLPYKMFGKGAKFAGKQGYAISSSVLGWASHHPWQAAGLGLVGYGVGSTLLGGGTPFDSGVNNGAVNAQMNPEAQDMVVPGIAPMGGITSSASIRNQTLLNSTYGLVQGLHRGRH